MWERTKADFRDAESVLALARDTIDKLAQQENETLSQRRQNLEELRTATILEARRLVNEMGASVRKSFALHCASRFRIKEYVDSLLELVPPQERSVAISERDTGGITPLHSALMGTPGLHDKDDYYAFASHLIALGANSNARDPFDRTPLGQHRTVMVEIANFTRVFGSGRDVDDPNMWRPYNIKMEELLRPSLGETHADRNAKPPPQRWILETMSMWGMMLMKISMRRTMAMVKWMMTRTTSRTMRR